MSTVPKGLEPPRGLTRGEPTWGVVGLFPAQGEWTERDYLDLDTNHFVEFSDGFVEFLPMPKLSHQMLSHRLHCQLEAFTSPKRLGTVVGAPYKVRLRNGKYREPDLVFVREEHRSRLREEYSDGADLVMEVVSESDADRERDLVTKRAEYARAGISEYWIGDRREGRVTVLALEAGGAEYAVHGEFRSGATATSRLLPGFALNVDEVLAAKV